MITDEAIDPANDEKLAISICFVDCCIHKKNFYQCTPGINGEAIACDILQQYTSWKMNFFEANDLMELEL